jgi:hypothetical protein
LREMTRFVGAEVSRCRVRVDRGGEEARQHWPKL